MRAARPCSLPARLVPLWEPSCAGRLTCAPPHPRVATHSAPRFSWAVLVPRFGCTSARVRCTNTKSSMTSLLEAFPELAFSCCAQQVPGVNPQYAPIADLLPGTSCLQWLPGRFRQIGVFLHIFIL